MQKTYIRANVSDVKALLAEKGVKKTFNLDLDSEGGATFLVSADDNVIGYATGSVISFEWENQKNIADFPIVAEHIKTL